MTLILASDSSEGIVFVYDTLAQYHDSSGKSMGSKTGVQKVHSINDSLVMGYAGTTEDIRFNEVSDQMKSITSITSKNKLFPRMWKYVLNRKKYGDKLTEKKFAGLCRGREGLTFLFGANIYGNREVWESQSSKGHGIHKRTNWAIGSGSKYDEVKRKFYSLKGDKNTNTREVERYLRDTMTLAKRLSEEEGDKFPLDGLGVGILRDTGYEQIELN